jgi:hypothetical protein
MKMTGLLFLVSAVSAFAEAEVYPLWSGPAIPADPGELAEPEGLVNRTIHDARESDYKFLHGAAIVHFKGRFFVNWANSPRDENKAFETLQGRRSTDGGESWSGLEVIGSDLPGEDRRSHAAYLKHKGQLWIFAARFGTGEPGRFTGLRAEAFVLNETSDEWDSKGIVMNNCWPYEEPVLMGNGNYIVAGQDKDKKAVVAISHGGDLTQWDTVLIPCPPAMKYSFAETTVWAEGVAVTAVIRTRTGLAWVATSADGGRIWKEARPSNMPMPDSKAYLGKLSTGQLYMISNLKNRDSLVISVGKPGEQALCSMWRIRHGSSKPIPRFTGSAKAPQWSYPCAYEHDGKLFIVYSIGKEDCGLSVVPIESLSIQ